MVHTTCLLFAAALIASAVGCNDASSSGGTASPAASTSAGPGGDHDRDRDHHFDRDGAPPPHDKDNR